MSARDDYPGLAASVDAWFTVCAVSRTEAQRALDEIDALRAATAAPSLTGSPSPRVEPVERPVGHPLSRRGNNDGDRL